MIVKSQDSFYKDITKLRNQKIQDKLLSLIEFLEKIDSISEISDFKKMKGFETAYRIRLGDYRLGIYIEDQTITLSRFIHRKDVYKYFPKG